MKVYKTRTFDKWCKREAVSDSKLCEAIDELVLGLIDADLGAGLIKKRMSKSGQGKRGSYRTLLAFRSQHRAVFLSGFSKNEIENISLDEKRVLKKLCLIYLSAHQTDLDAMCINNLLIEVCHEAT